MNKIIRRHYPASRLPEDLREGLPADAEVTIVVEQEDFEKKKVMTLEEIFALAKPGFASGEEVDAYVKSMRDEWDAEN
jgi:hypothetical protein